MKAERRPLPLRRSIPNLITGGNLVCGMIALLLVLKGNVAAACWMIPLAVAFDFSDGLVARALRVSSAFGMEFDSLGDLISFGVTPAALIYITYLKTLPDMVGIVISVFFTLSGALRLARFNVTTAPCGTFCGLPIPAGGLFLTSIVIGKLPLPPAVVAGLTVMTGFLMISSVPYGNLKGVSRDQANSHRVSALLAFLIVTLSLARSKGLFILTGIYIISGLVSFNWGSWISTKKEKKNDDPESDTHTPDSL